MTSDPKFSVIIPTRNRARTLRHTLQTCLDQTCQSFEVVVTDNFSDDETQALLASIEDPRLRHVRTSSYVSMSRNFQNGLRHARGENLIFIGDDDGMLPFGLELLERILDSHPEVDAVRWVPASFWWPHARNYDFAFQLSDFNHHRTIERSDEVLPRVTHPKILNFHAMTGFTLYHGCWRRSVADRALADGLDLFDGPIPDVLSSIYGLRYARACLRLEAPISIMGVSSKSNGWATSAVAPTDEQKIMRADFVDRSRRDYPDAPPITFSFCACSPYFGSLLTYWLKSHGTLTTFDHEAWRTIFLSQLTFLYDGDADLQRDYNDHIVWLRTHGVEEARGISDRDIETFRASGERMPDVFDNKVPPVPSLWAVLTAASRSSMQSVQVRRSGDFYIGPSQVPGPEFTVKDFADFFLRVLCLPRAEAAAAIANDPSYWRRMSLIGLERQRLEPSWWARLARRVLGHVPDRFFPARQLPANESSR